MLHHFVYHSATVTLYFHLKAFGKLSITTSSLSVCFHHPIWNSFFLFLLATFHPFRRLIIHCQSMLVFLNLYSFGLLWNNVSPWIWINNVTESRKSVEIDNLIYLEFNRIDFILENVFDNNFPQFLFLPFCCYLWN